MSEQVFLILLSLAGAPMHGYAIITETARLSDDRIRLATGTLYGALKRLLDDGLIERIAEKDAPRDRIAYGLTKPGRHQLQLEIERIQQLAAVSRPMDLRKAR